MPSEVVVQYSDTTDSLDVLLKNAVAEAKDSNKPVLEVFLSYAKETLETYDDVYLAHVNYELKNQNYKQWKSERKEIVDYIKKIRNYLK
jgi:dsDNA-binding SOS-regulon protein